MNNWPCLIFLFVGAMLAEVCFNLTYGHAIFGSELENIPNRILYGLHFLGLALAIMEMFDMIKLVKKQGGYKRGVQADLSYFLALKTQILRVLKKLKAIIKL